MSHSLPCHGCGSSGQFSWEARLRRSGSGKAGRQWAVSGKCAAIVLAAVVAIWLCGCGAKGPARAAVKGRVTLDGLPLPSGAIHFVPVGDTKGPLAAGRIVNGEYALSSSEGPVVGRVRVEIYSPTEPSVPLDDPVAFAGADASAVPQERLPARYNRASNQFVDITAAGENAFDFNLTSDP